MGRVRRKLSKNIYFAKQVPHLVHRSRPNNSTYTYDYSLLKPRRSALVNFARTQGRGQGDKLKTESNHSYQHFDYDSFAEERASHLFPNTKTHLIGFDKQLNRYRPRTEEEGLD